MNQKIAVLDFGSQYTQVIARRIRECSVYSEIMPFNTKADVLKKQGVCGIILSGGPASVLAKVTRDRYMEKLDAEFPEYGWAHNAGYLTKDHLDAIDKYGLCKYHRKSFLNKHFAKEEQLKLF